MAAIHVQFMHGEWEGKMIGRGSESEDDGVGQREWGNFLRGGENTFKLWVLKKKTVGGAGKGQKTWAKKSAAICRKGP